MKGGEGGGGETEIEIQTKEALEKYEVSNILIGEGAFSKVYLGHLRKYPETKIAVKEITITSRERMNPKFIQRLEREIGILRKFDHPNIVKIYDVVQQTGKLMIFFEFCKDKDLKYLLSSKGSLTESEALDYMKQICSAFYKLYESNIIHRDLKPANILLHDNLVKISDFGFARELQVMNEPSQLTRYGSPQYMSPQILKGVPFSSKSDIWSLGIMVYQMIYGKTPWIGDTPEELLRNICLIPLKFPKKMKVSDEFTNLISKMLVIEESRRISWTKIFEEPLINLKESENHKEISAPTESSLPSNLQLNSISESAEIIIDRQLKPKITQERGKKNSKGLFSKIKKFFCCI